MPDFTGRLRQAGVWFFIAVTMLLPLQEAVSSPLRIFGVESGYARMVLSAPQWKNEAEKILIPPDVGIAKSSISDWSFWHLFNRNCGDLLAWRSGRYPIYKGSPFVVRAKVFGRYFLNVRNITNFYCVFIQIARSFPVVFDVEGEFIDEGLNIFDRLRESSTGEVGSFNLSRVFQFFSMRAPERLSISSNSDSRCGGGEREKSIKMISDGCPDKSREIDGAKDRTNLENGLIFIVGIIIVILFLVQTTSKRNDPP
jgi:hypothetical protein